MAKRNRTEQRHATMADVAAHVGVSRQLVGFAFRNAPGVNAQTAAKIFAAAKEIGYSPNLAAQSLRGDATKYIGVVFNSSHSSVTDLLPAIYKAAETQKLRVILSAISKDRSEQAAIDEVIGHRCDGIILISSDLPDASLRELAKNYPLTVLSRHVANVRCGLVASDGQTGMHEATNHLISLGHKSISYINAKDMWGGDLRLDGYKSAMAQANLKIAVINISGDYVEAGGGKAAKKLLALPKLPTAIVCSNDQIALGLVHTFLKAGIRVPQEVSVVGYDDTLAKLPFLNLTTVHQDATELAKTTIDDLAARIKGEKSKSETYLTSAKLIVRSSTTKPRAKI